MAIYAAGSDLYTTIIAIIQTLPLAPFVLVLLIVAMVAFYATSFDSIALVDPAAHGACIFRQLHGKPTECLHHCSVSGSVRDPADHRQLLKGRVGLPEIIK